MNNIVTLFDIPKSIIFINEEEELLLDNDIPTFYLQEKKMFQAAFEFWDSVPIKFRKNINSKEFLEISKNNMIKPKDKINIDEPYVVLHIRQNDVSFNATSVISKLINRLKILDNINTLSILIISDAGSKYIEQILNVFSKNNIKTINDKYSHFRDKNYKADKKLQIDYSLMWFSSGIICLSKRNYSSLPYCIARQTKIPLLFFPKSTFRCPFINNSLVEFIFKYKKLTINN